MPMSATPTPVSTPVKTIVESFSKSLTTTHAAATKHHVKGLVSSLGDKADKSLADIDAEDLTRWITGLPVNLASSTTDDHLKSVIALFGYGITEKVCIKNVARDNKADLKSKRAVVVTAKLAKKADENELDAAASDKSKSNDSIKSDESLTAGKIGKKVTSGDSAANARLEKPPGDSANHAASSSDPGDSSAVSKSVESTKPNLGNNRQSADVPKAICDFCLLKGSCRYDLPAKFGIPTEGECPITERHHSSLYNLTKMLKENGEPLVLGLSVGPRMEIDGASYCEFARTKHLRKANKKPTSK